MAKKFFLPIMEVVAVPPPLPPFYLKLVIICVKRRLFSFLNYILRLKPSLKITDYMKVAKIPPRLWFTPKQYLSGHLLHGEISILFQLVGTMEEILKLNIVSY